MDVKITKLQKILGFKFKNEKLLQQAFIHRSYLNEVNTTTSSNERLEFLGDAVLSFIISSYLFAIRISDEEGELTNLRSYLVKTKSLAQAAQDLHLGDYLKLSKGEESGGGRKNSQLLANTYEALIGAIFLDLGIEAVTKFVYNTLLPLFEAVIKSGPPKDAKSALQEVTQEKTKQSPFYRILKTYGPDHSKRFTVGVFVKGKEAGRGEGKSKQEAEEMAAKEALKKIS